MLLPLMEYMFGNWDANLEEISVDEIIGYNQKVYDIRGENV